MKKVLLFLVVISNIAFAQMPNISSVWLNNSKPYTGTIGKGNKEIGLKINVSEQNKKNDQEYFVAGYSLIDTNYKKFEGKLTITKYKDFKKKGVIFGTYELAEEQKGKQSGLFTGKFTYTFKWNKSSEKIENQSIELIGSWNSYDKTLDLKTRLNSQ